VKDVKDELRDGDQVLVKVLSIDGNRIKLSRKAVLKEQRAKLGLPDPEQEQPTGGDEPRRERAPRPERGSRPEAPKHEDTITIEGGEDFDDDDEDDDFEGDEDEGGEENGVEENGDAPATPPQNGAPAANRPAGAGQKRRRRRGGRRPGQGGGAPQGGNS